MIWKLILIQIIIVYLVDLSGAIEDLKARLWKWLHPNRQYQPYNIKPFDCSLCMTFWLGLLYILLNNAFTLPYITAVCLLSFLTTTTKGALYLVKDIIDTTIMKIEQLLEEDDDTRTI